MREHVDDGDRLVRNTALERAKLVRRKDQGSDDGDNEKSGENYGWLRVREREREIVKLLKCALLY